MLYGSDFGLHAKIGDFGLIYPYEKREEHGLKGLNSNVIGTRRYMAPEVIHAKELPTEKVSDLRISAILR